jgi:hypothetical protein
LANHKQELLFLPFVCLRIKSISQADVSLATFILLAGFGNLVLKFGEKRHDFEYSKIGLMKVK